ncbi:MAG: hypothetical protein P8189_15695 [Anaerolineae bacterium]
MAAPRTPTWRWFGQFAGCQVNPDLATGERWQTETTIGKQE